MADLAAFAFFVADEVDAVEIPLLLREIEYDEQRRLVPKIQHFVEDVVPLYSVSEFRGHFRLSKGQVEDLINTLGPVYMNPQQTKLPLTKSVLACLWTLSNQESYRGISDRSNITKSTLAKHLHEFCTLVNTHMAHHISWRLGQTLHNSLLGFQAAGFPNTICAVDGCHIHIQKPHCENPLAYFNRKQFYSIILTGFCDSHQRFTHISVGHPGSWHDARAFRLTEVAHLLEEDPLVPQGMYIIGDSAYPLLPQLMRPYRDNGHLTARQKRFNRKLNTACVVIEHAFGILKAKFRRLQCLHMRNVLSISSAVSACCILHNVCLEPGDQGDDVQDEEDDEQHPLQPHNQDAVHYRDMICSHI